MGPVAAIVGASVIGGAASIYGAKKSAQAASDASAATVAESQRQFDLVRGDTAPYRQAGVSALDKLSRLYGLGPASGGAGAGSAGASPMSYEQFVASRGGIDGFTRGGGQFGLMNDYMASQDAYNAYTASLPGQQASGSVSPASSTPDMSVFFQSPDYQFNLAEGQKAIDRSLAARGRALSGAGVREGARYASGLASNEFGNFYNRLANIAGLGQSGVNTSASAGANAASNIGNAYQNAGAARGSAYMNMAQGINNSAQGGISNYLLMNYLKPGG